jgi:hypothetical protein
MTVRSEGEYVTTDFNVGNINHALLILAEHRQQLDEIRPLRCGSDRAQVYRARPPFSCKSQRFLVDFFQPTYLGRCCHPTWLIVTITECAVAEAESHTWDTTHQQN